MSFYYAAFGFNMVSDTPIFGVFEGAFGFEKTVLIQSLEFDYEAIEPQVCRFRINDVAEILVKNGNFIGYRKLENFSNSIFSSFILGIAFSIILHQNGFFVLHGCAVSRDGETCRIYVGDSGAGKSTLAMWNFLQGYLILSDDVVAICLNESGYPIAIPSYPQLKLKHDSAVLLGVDTSAYRLINLAENKFAVPLHLSFAPHPLRISEIVEILPAGDGGITYLGVEKLTKMIRFSYGHHFLPQLQIESMYLKKIIKLAPFFDFVTELRPQLVPNPPTPSALATAPSVILGSCISLMMGLLQASLFI